MTIWRCTRSKHILEIDDVLQPEGRQETKEIGSTYEGCLYVEEIHFLHCLYCESLNQCMICNEEYGRVIERV